MAEPIVAHDVLLVPPPGVGEPVGGLELRIDRSGVTQLGGTPVSAWQIPWFASRDVRVGRSHATVLLALSFGALRYRWELPESGIDGGVEPLLAALRQYAGSRPMLRGVRGARRRA